MGFSINKKILLIYKLSKRSQDIELLLPVSVKGNPLAFVLICKDGMMNNYRYINWNVGKEVLHSRNCV